MTRILIFLLLCPTLLIPGCVQQESTMQTPATLPTSTPQYREEVSASENVSEEIEGLEKEFLELEKLLNELEELENTSFEI